jgi:hypothetical protein
MLHSRKMLFVGVICLLANIFYSHKALAATTCDTVKFGQFFKSGGQTFALTTQPMTWEEANQAAKAAGGELAVIPDATINDEIQRKLSSSFSANPSGAKEAWIGLTDPANSATYCIDGQATPCTPMPERFSWSSGSSTYTNWAASKPDNRCTVAERIANPNYACYGEPWATMLTDGTWNDDGDHGPVPLKLKAIVQWSNILDCVQDVAPISLPTGDKLDPAAGLWCASQDKSKFSACLNTVGGGTLCPSDKLACNAVLETPTCLSGVLNTDSHMCQADPTVSCPAGGIPLGLACQQDFTLKCSPGYSLSADGSKCEATPVCDQGTYNHVTNKCEVPTSTTTGYAMPTSTGAVTISKYYKRGTTATSSGDYSPSPTVGLDVVQMIFGIENGKVVLKSECAWGGNGNCGDCATPNWNSSCKSGTDISQSTSGEELTATATMYDTYVDTYNPYCAAGWTLTSEESGPICYSIITNSEGEPQYSYIQPSYPLARNTYYGATGKANLSEFLSCPAGYSPVTPQTQSQCVAIFSIWGHAIGISDCTQSAEYTCAATIQACPVGQTPSPSGGCVLDTTNPYCATGNGAVTLNNGGLSNDQCFTSAIRDCPLGTTLNAAGDKCEGGAVITCPASMGFNGVPLNKCEAIPTCQQGHFIPASNTCYNQQNTCPSGNFQCSQIQGDSTESIPGIPMTYCSPNACVDDTTTQMVSEDTTAGENDIKPDGELDADGNCTGSIYIFNGTDSRCVKEDTRTVIVAVTKLAAQIAASVFLGPMGAFLVSAATSILGDAALGNLGTGTIMAVGFAAISAGVASYGSEMMNSVTSYLGESWNTLIGSVATDVASTGGTVINTASATVSTASTSTMSSLTTSIRDSLVEDFGLSAATADLVVDKGAGAAADMAEAGLFSSFSAMKCCYPDPLNAGCLPEEITQANNAKNGLCHIVGSYCATKWLDACVVTKETSCCYDSKIGRIIAEQGRPQLAAFAGIPNDGFGTAKSPVCRGFKPEEFQYIDMRKVDFAEFIEDITTRSSEQIKSMMENAGNKFRQGQLSTSTP